MSYKTILTVVTAATGEPSGMQGVHSLDAAVAMARRENAHLEVLALGIDRTQIGYYYAGASAMIYQETLERARTEAAHLAEFARKRLKAEDINWSVDDAVAQIGGLGGLVADRARFADLVVLPRPYGEGRGVESEAVIEAAMFDGQAPVLVMPDKLPEPGDFNRIVLAWNQAQEALVAARRALPLLTRASVVNIVVVDPPQHGPERSDPGGLLSQMLSRHGVRTEVSVIARTMPRISDVIARHLRDQDADLLVMGAYGHSRFTQAILGGTTRNMLEQAEIPVFMAH